MKAEGAWDNVLKGVSQQVPHQRAEGQHTEQVNMLTDPVNGLSRRHGSRWLAENNFAEPTPEEMESYIADTDNWTTIEHRNNGVDYVGFLRRKPRSVTANPLPGIMVYNRTDGYWLTIQRNAVDALLDDLNEGGVSAAVAVGAYLYMAGNNTPTSGSTVQKFNNATNLSTAVIWFRGGAYSRKFSGKFTTDTGYQFGGSFTTLPSAYTGVLDTSDILTADPDYTKKVNDRVNAYNSAVTQHIATSTAQIQPNSLAKILADGVPTADFPGWPVGVTATAIGSTVYLTGIRSLAVDDGGDGSLIRGVGDEVESADKLSLIHKIGKVVKVRGKNSQESYYMEAVAKDKLVTSGAAEVTWVECAGMEFHIDHAFCMATVVGTNLFLASSAALLTALVTGPHPDFAVSTAGDINSAPYPYATNKVIDYLGTFQNRLVMGAGGVLTFSKTDDYLNFFRSTVLTVPDDDPFDLAAQGNEDDTIKHSVVHDQNLVLFGVKRQYIISGRSALTASSANMAVMSSYADTADAPPVALGGLIFMASRNTKYSSVYQIQPGQGLQNSPEAFPASNQVDTYIPGGIIEFGAYAGPTTLFARATGDRYALYVFSYIDSPQGRKLDSWSRWQFDEAMGPIIGISAAPEGILVYTVRAGANGICAVADLVPMATGLSEYPYLDSHRAYSQVLSGTGSIQEDSTGPIFGAFDDSTNRRYLGVPLECVPELQELYADVVGLRVGYQQEAYFEPTNPYMRDGNDKAILSGRLTIGKVTAGMKDSAGFTATISVNGVIRNVETFNGRTMGLGNNVIGQEPISSQLYSIPIGKETRDYSLRIAARTWLPFTLTSLEWAGQFFNRTQRF